MLPVHCPSPDASAPEPESEARGRTPQGAWSGRGLGGGAWATVPQRQAACLRSTYDERWGRQEAGGRGAGPGPSGTMAKTVAYFYDPDVGNFHYGEGTRWYARGLGTRRFRGWGDCSRDEN